MRADEEMCGEQGFKAVHKMVHWVKFIGKGCKVFSSTALVFSEYGPSCRENTTEPADTRGTAAV